MLLSNKYLQWLRPLDFGPPYSSRPWDLDEPFELLGYALNPDIVAMCEESKVFELYVWLGYRMILVLFVCVGYVSSLVIVVSVLRSLTGDDGLLGPLGSINGYSSTGMNKELG